MTRIDLDREHRELRALPIADLQQRLSDLTGEPTRSRHREYVMRRILWRIQAAAEGGLSARARRRAEEIADDAQVRVTPPRRALATAVVPVGDAPPVATVPPVDRRLPPVGASLTRIYRGNRITVDVLDDGFSFAGARYGSLTAVARAITGSHINGYRFFGLGTPRGDTK